MPTVITLLSFMGLLLTISLNESNVITERNILVKQVYEGIFWGAVKKIQNNVGQIYLIKSKDKSKSICRNLTAYFLENPPKYI